MRPVLVRAIASACAVAALCFRLPAGAADDGAEPARVRAMLVRSGDALYGIASAGGGACSVADLYTPLDGGPMFAGCGAILRFGPGGTVSVVHAFRADEGAGPFALRAGAKGMLFGVTRLGGAFGRGTAFRFDPATRRLDVLQSLGDDADLDRGYASPPAAAFDDGTVLSEDPDDGAFYTFTAGGARHRIFKFPAHTDVGPFDLAAGGRAVLTEKPSGACDVALVALSREGKVATLIAADRSGSPACTADVLAGSAPIRAGDDGSIVANDGDRIYTGRPGGRLHVAASAATLGGTKPGSALYPGTALEMPDGDLIVAMSDPNDCGGIARIHDGRATTAATFDGKNVCAPSDASDSLSIASNGDAVYGIILDNGGDRVFVASAPAALASTLLAPARDLREIALLPQLYFEPLESGGVVRKGAISVDWHGAGGLSVPDLRVDPHEFYLDVRKAGAAPHAGDVRLVSIARTIAPTRTDMTMEKEVTVTVPFVLPHLAPGTYTVVARAGGAIRTKQGTVEPVVDDGAPAYLYVSQFDAGRSVSDREIAALEASFARHKATVIATLPFTCPGTQGTFDAGVTVTIKSVTRDRLSPASTGYGPRGVHAILSGAIAAARAPFFALDPITIRFTPPGSFCDDASASFSSLADVRRYLRP